MPAAIAIPLLISAGTSVAQGVIASKAAKKAAKQQTEASTVGLEQVAQPVYQEQRQLWNPYVQTGRGALGNLAALTGIPGPGPQEPRPNYGPGGPNAMPLGQMGQRSPMMGQAGTLGTMRLPSGGVLSNLGQQTDQVMKTMAGQQVTLRAPDGSTQAVPFDQAQHYINMGATRVG